MLAEPYQPELHEPWLAALHEAAGWPFLRELLSAHGYVARDADGDLLACVFLYRDPSSSVVFADNVLASPASAFRIMAALRALWRAVAAACAECLVVVQTDSRFVMATLRRDRVLAAPMQTFRVSAPFFGKGA